jgi:hypothetical protein
MFSDPMSPNNPHYQIILNKYAGYIEEYLSNLTTNSAGELISKTDEKATAQTISEPLESIRRVAAEATSRMLANRIENIDDNYRKGGFDTKYRLTWSGNKFYWILAGISIPIVLFVSTICYVLNEGKTGYFQTNGGKEFMCLAILILCTIFILCLIFCFIPMSMMDASSPRVASH